MEDLWPVNYQAYELWSKANHFREGMNGNLSAYAVKWFAELLEIPASSMLELIDKLISVDFLVRKHWEAQKDMDKQVAEQLKKAEPLTIDESKAQRKLLQKDMRKRLKIDTAKGGTNG